jgi:hypothetical protein
MWRPVALGVKEPHWEISLDSPRTGDAVKDLNEFARVRDLLHDHVGAVSVTFQQ